MKNKLIDILEKARYTTNPLEDLEQELLNLHSVSKRVFCFLYSDGDEVYNKSAIAETRTEARKIIENKYPNLFLLRDEQSYENVR